MRKVLVLLSLFGFIALSFFVFLFQATSAFTIHSKPSYISKGSYGHTLVIEIAYTNKQFNEWVDILTNKPVLVLIEEDWFKRSPKQIEILKERNFEIGLLFSNDMTAEEMDSFIADASTYFEQPIIWAGCYEEVCHEPVLHYLFEQKINTLAISSYITDAEKFEDLPEGTIIGVKIADHELMDEKVFQQIQSYPFVSIEDNIFRVNIQKTKLPE